MDDKEIVATYACGIYIMSLLDEYGKSGRIGASAKIFNTIEKKNAIFYKQINDVKHGKKKRYSHKCELFIKASAIAISAWDETIKETKGLKMCIETTVHNLYRLDQDNFTRIFGLTHDIFQQLDSRKAEGLILSSCRMSRVLLEITKKEVEKKILDKNRRNIYKEGM